MERFGDALPRRDPVTMPTTATPEERYATIVEALLGEPGVTYSSDPTGSRKKFGSSALKIHGKIFAMLVGDRLVVKLPRQRVDALIANREGERFLPGHGRQMKEWLTVEPLFGDGWLLLAKEAMVFVAGRR